MAFNGEYKCTECGKVTGTPDQLVVKKVMFNEIGIRPKTFKSRSVAWLCGECLAKDPHWNLPSHVGPGHQQ